MKKTVAFVLALVLSFGFTLSAFSFGSLVTTKSQEITSAEQTTAAQRPNVGKTEGLEAFGSTTTSIDLHWLPAEQAQGYAVYIKKNPSDSFDVITAVEETSYTVDGLSAGETYYFAVCAFSVFEGETIIGQMSETVSAVTACKRVSGIVTSDITKSSVTLSWSKLHGATSYEIWVYNSEDERFSLSTISKSNTAVIGSLSKDTAYSFKIRAVREEKNAVSYGKFSEIYSEFTDTDSVPYTKAQAAKLYNGKINAAKALKTTKLSYSKKITTKAYSCTNQSLLRTVKNIMNLFSGSIAPNYSFSSGKSGTVSLNSVLQPYTKQSSLRGNDIKSFSTSKKGGKTTLKLVLKSDSSSYTRSSKTTTAPPKTSRAVKTPGLQSLNTSPITVKSATQTFSGVTLTAVTNKSGKLESLAVCAPVKVTADCRVSTVKFKTTVGYTMTESYKFK